MDIINQNEEIARISRALYIYSPGSDRGKVLREKLARLVEERERTRAVMAQVFSRTDTEVRS